MTTGLRSVLAAMIVTAGMTPAVAQTGAGLVLRPWRSENEPGQLQARAVFVSKGHTKNTDAKFQMRHYNASGRWRPEVGRDHTTSFGAELDYFNLTSTDPAIPERLMDQSVAGAFLLTDPGEHRSLWLVVGVGYAGGNPFGDDQAVYGMADLIYREPIDATSAWQLVFNYDGNRTIFPDVPLPALAYERQASETLGYTIGLPASGISWKPAERWTVRATYLVPVTASAVVEYDLGGGWSMVGQFEDTTHAFTIDGDQDHRRLFLQQQRLEAGVRLRSDQRVDLTLAGGYSFAGEFNRGFDVRGLDDVAEFSDEPYLRLAVDFHF